MCKLDDLQYEWTKALQTGDAANLQRIEAEMKSLGYDGPANSVKASFRKSALRAACLNEAELQATWKGYIFGIDHAIRRIADIGKKCAQLGIAETLEQITDLEELLCAEIDEYMSKPKKTN